MHTLTHAFLQTLRNAVNKAGTTIATLFNRLDRRLKSKDEKELLTGDLERSAGKTRPPKKKSGKRSRHHSSTKTAQVK